jgi:choline dehydrogenase-like flavoprotein
MGAQALTPYLARACELRGTCEFGLVAGGTGRLGETTGCHLLVATGDLRRVALRWRPPTNFGTRYRPALEHTDGLVRLGSEPDRFGLRRAQLDWQLQAGDKETLRRAVTDFGRRMAADRIGRVRIRDWVMDTDASFPGYRDHAMGGHHHMGTTRMARRPEEGVVDPDSRVFGTDNLYMAGSSVFPTMGYANPTLTIVQMTLRLADHLNRVLRRS